MQPRFDGFRPQAEQIGGFLHAHPFDNPCNEDSAEGIRKLDRSPAPAPRVLGLEPWFSPDRCWPPRLENE